MTSCRRTVLIEHPDRRPPALEPGALPPFSASVCLCGGNLSFHLQHVNDLVNIPHPWSLNGLLHLMTHTYLLHPPLDQNSTVFFLDRLSTFDCCCQRRRSDHAFHGRNAVSEVGSRPRHPRPTRWNASSCIIEADDRDCDHNFVRLQIGHLDNLEYCSFFTRFALVSSYYAACSCSASFQLFTRLLDLRSAMRFFLSFPSAVGSFLGCC